LIAQSVVVVIKITRMLTFFIWQPLVIPLSFHFRFFTGLQSETKKYF